jgi:hypothetical protein
LNDSSSGLSGITRRIAVEEHDGQRVPAGTAEYRFLDGILSNYKMVELLGTTMFYN